MIDYKFTLGELKLLQDNLHWNDCPDINQKLLILNNKLESMIENYCDHDFENTYSEQEIWRCTKCGTE